MMHLRDHASLISNLKGFLLTNCVQCLTLGSFVLRPQAFSMLLALLGTAELDGLGALLVSHTKSLQNIAD